MAFQGGYYLIKSRLNGLVLDVERANASPGAHVITYQKHGKDNQQFYDDTHTHTIRSKLNNFCLDIEGDALSLKPYQQGDIHQQWERRDNYIRNLHNGKVLDIMGKNHASGARISWWEQNNGTNQLWDFEFVGGQPPVAFPSGYPSGGYPSGPGGYPQQGRREFFIVSELNHKVLDIQGASKDKDAKLIMYTKHTPAKKNQLWYLDQQGIIRSALNDFAIQAESSGKALKMTPHTGHENHHWFLEGNKIVNRITGDCMDIKGDSKSDGAKVISYQYKNQPNQHWRFEYV